MDSEKELLNQFTTNLRFHISEILNLPLAKPYWIYISLSHKCNFSCQMCEVKNILKGQELDTDTLKSTLNEIADWGSDCVVMLTGGEPFLRSDIFELIGHSIAKGLKTEVVSNGSLIDEKLAYRIISSGLKNIAVSLDGVRESTHDFIREKGAFKKAINAIKNLIKVKNELGKGPQISIWTTIMKENIGELYDIISLVKELGAECLVYHPVIVAQDDMQNTSADAPFWIKNEKLEILKEQIDKIKDYQSKYGLVAFLHDPDLWIKYFEIKLGKKDWKCNPFVFINIGPDGEVRSCGASFGNIKKIGLNGSLNTKDASKARSLMRLCQKPCLQTCWAHPESDSLAKIGENFVKLVAKNKNRTKLLREGLKILERFEEQLIDYKNA